MPQSESDTQPETPFVIFVDEERLTDVPKHDLLRGASLNDKFNIRIRKEDVVLLDAISEAEGVSRADILNKIVQQTLLNQLQKLEGLDTRLAVALAADRLAGHDNLETPWAHDVLSGLIGQLIGSIRKHGRSDVSPVQIHHYDLEYQATLDDPEELSREKGHSETYFQYSQRIEEALK